MPERTPVYRIELSHSQKQQNRPYCRPRLQVLAIMPLTIIGVKRHLMKSDAWQKDMVMPRPPALYGELPQLTVNVIDTFAVNLILLSKSARSYFFYYRTSTKNLSDFSIKYYGYLVNLS